MSDNRAANALQNIVRHEQDRPGGPSTVTWPLGDRQLAEEVSEALVGPTRRSVRNQLAEAFICGIQVGADEPDLAGDGDAMYAAFRTWHTEREGS